MTVLDAMPKYEVYKDSEVDYLEGIPNHWQKKRFKFLATVKKGKLPKKIVTSPQGAALPYLSMEYLRGGVANQYVLDSNALIIRGNEILLLWDGSNSGEFIKSREGVISSTVALINYYGIIKRFAWYVSHLVEAKLRSTTIGMGIPHVNGNELANSWLTIPPHKEQTVIANFLDKKTAQIDEAITIKQKQIELLKERKQILIQKAVTQGLDPNVPLRDSSVDWIGKVPEHWDVKRAKYLFNEIDERSTNGNEELLSVSHITGVTPRSEKNVTMVAEDYTGSKTCQKNDLIINIMWAWMGALGVSDRGGIVSSAYSIYRQAPIGILNPVYLEWLLKTTGYMEHYNKVSTGLHSSRLRFYSRMFFDMEMAYPDRIEQDQIVEYIEKQLNKIDEAISLEQAQTEKLKEYKTTLINSAVTGKIKIAGNANDT